MTAKAPVGGARPFRMIAGVSKIGDLADGSGALGALMAAGGKWYYCNPTAGNGYGDSAESATKDLLAAYNLCRDGYNDGVIFIGGATAYNPAAAFDWSKSYCHLIGLSADLPGRGQRCRVVAQNATALTQAMTISGSGNVFSNIQFNNELSTGASGSAVVTGSRNLFQNCFFMNPSSRTAATWALKVSGQECTFARCSIGQFTNLRTAADYGLWLATPGNSNKFLSCEFSSWSDVKTHVHVYLGANTTEAWQVQFENCLFQQLGAASLTQAIDDDSTAPYHQIIFRGRDNVFIKADAVADTLTYTYVFDQGTTASGLLAVIVAES